MARNGIAVLCIAVFLAAFEMGSCLQCYQCSSSNNTHCGDPFSKTGVQLVDCSLPRIEDLSKNPLSGLPQQFQTGISQLTSTISTFCLKLKTSGNVVSRSCYPYSGNPNDLCKTLETGGAKCSTCDTDLCNGAGGISVSWSMGFLALAASYLFFLQ